MNSPNSNHSEGQIALDLFKSNHKPDILQCLANLSNDEVFTPPEIANKMLDLLPEEIWSNPNIKFLSSIWSPPKFMKSNKMLVLGGKLIKEHKQTVDRKLKDELGQQQSRITNKDSLLKTVGEYIKALSGFHHCKQELIKTN